jgi:hypothetical protein
VLTHHRAFVTPVKPAPGDRRARSDTPYLPSPAACRVANSPYGILGLLPDPEGGLSDITGLYLDKFSLLPAGQRIFIQTVQQINGWRDLPKTIPAQ